MWLSKKQNLVQTSTFLSELNAMKKSVDMTKDLRYNLSMLGVPIDGPTNMHCENEEVYKNATTPESVLNKNHHYCAYHMCWE